jgi:hypothetical protein
MILQFHKRYSISTVRTRDQAMMTFIHRMARYLTALHSSIATFIGAWHLDEIATL